MTRVFPALIWAILLIISVFGVLIALELFSTGVQIFPLGEHQNDGWVLYAPLSEQNLRRSLTLTYTNTVVLHGAMACALGLFALAAALSARWGADIGWIAGGPASVFAAALAIGLVWPGFLYMIVEAVSHVSIYTPSAILWGLGGGFAGVAACALFAFWPLERGPSAARAFAFCGFFTSVALGALLVAAGPPPVVWDALHAEFGLNMFFKMREGLGASLFEPDNSARYLAPNTALTDTYYMAALAHIGVAAILCAGLAALAQIAAVRGRAPSRLWAWGLGCALGLLTAVQVLSMAIAGLNGMPRHYVDYPIMFAPLQRVAQSAGLVQLALFLCVSIWLWRAALRPPRFPE